MLARPRTVGRVPPGRGGTLAYLAAIDTSSGPYHGFNEATTGIAPSTQLVDHATPA